PYTTLFRSDTRVDIGDHVMIGPNVTISTASHPLNPELRLKHAQFNKPVTIEKNVWIGANVTIFPGVTIGENSVIGAGSVVTKDIPNKDRKSTRLNSSHVSMSYAVCCLKQKNQ